MKYMNSGRALAFGLVLAQALSLTADVYYRPDWDGGSGTWSDATRYYEGRVPNNEILFFNPNQASKPQPIDVTITDADWNYLSSRITRLQGKTDAVRIELAFESDYSWGGQIYGSGSIVKTGAGAFRMTQESAAALSFGGRLIVSNGLFKTGKQYQDLKQGSMPVVEVQAPGVFTYPSSTTFWLKGLTGNGSVTCGNGSGQFCFMGSSDAFVFTGNMLTNISLTAGRPDEAFEAKPKCRQIIACADHSFTPTLRLYGGTLGVTHFGIAGSPSSLGNASGDGDRRFHVFDNVYRHSENTILNAAEVPQTTDRPIRIMNGTGTNGVILTVDGGDYGALTWAGAFQNARAYNSQSQVIPMNYWDGHVTPIYLTGATTGGVCTIAGAVTEEVTTNHLFFTKRGSGTWRFAHNASRGFKTPVAVERGTLEYETIAEKGSNCSLGLATDLTTNWTGFATAHIPYAYLLGDGSDASVADLATFRYVGTSAASCTTRPIGILGAARLMDGPDAGATLSGVSAATPQATLVLDGTSSSSQVNHVTNGVGVLSVEKRGSGTWSLDGDLAYTGTTTVKQGTLALKIAAPNYKWFRLTLKKVYGEGQYNHLVQRLAFFAADDTDQALGLAYNSAANGQLSKLQPGQCAYGYSDTTCGKTLDKLFTAAGDELSIYRTATPVVSFDNPASWVSIVVRLPDTAAPVVKYDFVPGWYTHGSGPFGRTPTDWDLEASADGVNWDAIDSERNQTKSYVSGGYGDRYWVSDGSKFIRDDVPTVPTAYAVDSHGVQRYQKPSSLTDVTVAAGATLTADAAVSLTRLSFSTVDGAGTLSGFAFAAAGVVEVTGVVPRSGLKLAYDLSACTDVENLADWQVSVNGQIKSGYSVSIRADGLEVRPLGMQIIVR